MSHLEFSIITTATLKCSTSPETLSVCKSEGRTRDGQNHERALSAVCLDHSTEVCRSGAMDTAELDLIPGQGQVHSSLLVSRLRVPRMSWIILLLVSILVSSVRVYGGHPTFNTTPGSELSRSFFRRGDISIAAILPMFDSQTNVKACPGDRQSFSSDLALQYTEPFLFMLRGTNFTLSASAWNGSSEIVRSLSLGFHVFDQCKGDDAGLTEAAAIFHQLASKKNVCNISGSQGVPRIMAAIGPSAEEDKVAMTAPISSSYGLVQIATRSTRDEFSCIVSNGDVCKDEYEYLFRASSSDVYQAYAISDLLQYFNWTHFGVVAAQDVTSIALLNAFQKRIAELGFCPAFIANIGTEKDARYVDLLLRSKRHQRAKVLIVFGGEDDVRFLANTILKHSDADGKNDVPRIWVGNDKWGAARDLIFSEKDGKKYRRTMQAVLGLGKRTLTRFLGGEWPLKPKSFIKQYTDFILSVTAGGIRQDPLLTANPFLCHAMELHNNCSGVCPGNPTDSLQPRCSDDVRFSPMTKTGEHLSELVEPFTMVATEIVLQALLSLFSQFVRDQPHLSGDELAREFYDYAYGERLRAAVKELKLLCGDGKTDCPVFPGQSQEFVPEYHIVAASMSLQKAALVGHWKATGFKHTPTGVSLFVNKSLVSFGPELFDRDNNSSLSTFRPASEALPTSICRPRCPPGYGIWPPQPVCCHVCVRCTGASASEGGYSQCRLCWQGQYPNANHSLCAVLPIVALTTRMWLAVCISCAMMVTVLLGTMFVFVHFRKKALIRGADVILTMALLTMMVTGVVSVVVYLAMPTVRDCALRQLLSTASLLSLTILVLVKTSRFARIIYMVERFTRPRRQWTMSTTAQLVFATLLLVLGLAIQFISTAISPPQTDIVYASDATYEICVYPVWLTAAVDTFLMLLICITTVLAFYTRKLPSNNNEASLLLLTSFSQCVLWALLRPMYYLSKPQNRPLPKILLILTHVGAIWLWLFVPRLYGVLHRPHRLNRTSRRSAGFLPTRLTLLCQYTHQWQCMRPFRSVSLVIRRGRWQHCPRSHTVWIESQGSMW